MANPNNPLAPGLNGAAPKGPRTIWNNPVFSAVLAIIMGFAMWIIVTVYIDPQGSTTVTGVPINYTSGASTYTAQGLDIVEKPDIEGVTVKVEGNSTIIGNIRSADIMVYPSYAGVSGAGKVTLRLQARVTNTTDFPGDIECTVESPSTIDVVFDEVSEKTVTVTVDDPDMTAISYTVHYRLPEDGKRYDLWVKTENGWETQDSTVDGSYLLFTSDRETVTFCVQERTASPLLWVLLAVLILLALMLVVIRIRKKRGRQTIRSRLRKARQKKS